MLNTFRIAAPFLRRSNSSLFSPKRVPSPLYKGAVERLILFAAPVGAGKSAFLKTPERRMDRSCLPDELLEFFTIAREHREIQQLRKARRSAFRELCLHVDLTTPLVYLPNKPQNRQHLLERINADLFINWPELRSCIENSRTVDVVTLFVRQPENFRRWTGRMLQENPNRQCRTLLAMINGDDELHRQVYRAWSHTIQQLNPRSCHIIDGNQERYRFMPYDEFAGEIQNCDKQS